MYHLVAINCRYTHSCLALFYLRQALEENVPGSLIRISQFTLNDPYYSTLLRLSVTGTEAIFFSVYIWNHRYIQRLINDLILIRPGLPLILGGPQAARLTGLPQWATLVLGEIEGLDSRFYQDLSARCLQPVYQARSASRFSSPYRPDDFGESLQHRQVYYESSRGCPFSCSYCLSSICRGTRHLELDQVRRELTRILRAKPKMIRFVDRTFNADQQRALELWRFLAAQSVSTRFHFEIAPDRFTRQMHETLQSVPPGRFQFEVGFQSFTPQTLQAVDRQMDLDAAVNHVSRLIALDTIHIHADLILGLPYETQESFRRSFNRIFALAPHYLQLGLLKVLPGTKLAGQSREFGLVHCTEPPYEILATRWMDHETLGYLHGFCSCVEIFYNNRFFPSIWRYLRQKQEDPFSFFVDLLELGRKEQLFILAPTQAFLNRLMVLLARLRPDTDLLVDLLRYDWLRCGHRFLPPELDGVDLQAVRKEMRMWAPQSMAGVYSHKDREPFFRQSIFLPLGSDALKVLDLGKRGQGGIVAFLPLKTSGVRAYNKVVLLDT